MAERPYRTGWYPVPDDASQEMLSGSLLDRAVKKKNSVLPMTDSPFSTDDAEESSGTRPNFVAEVVRSEPNTDDEDFQTKYESDIDIVYELNVLDHDWENLYELGLNVSGSIGSKFMILTAALENVLGPEEVRSWGGPEDMAEALGGMVFEFQDLDLTADEDFTFQHKGDDGHTINLEDTFGDLENPPESMLIPVRQVTDEDELADAGHEGSGEVEQVSLGE